MDVRPAISVEPDIEPIAGHPPAWVVKAPFDLGLDAAAVIMIAENRVPAPRTGRVNAIERRIPFAIAHAGNAVLVEIVTSGDDEPAGREVAHGGRDLALMKGAVPTPIPDDHELQRRFARRDGGTARGPRGGRGRTVSQKLPARRPAYPRAHPSIRHGVH